ncbi:MAG: hypothetical protein KME47_17620 [Nodosilinea sp. WJT8-NPBG4]|nr:hypothetical protein [Nodosilinea sp. WJT8-NPBG4]
MGNKHDGYEVNNTYRGEEVDLALELKGYNQGTPEKFYVAASLGSDRKRQVLWLRPSR